MKVGHEYFFLVSASVGICGGLQGHHTSDNDKRNIDRDPHDLLDGGGCCPIGL